MADKPSTRAPTVPAKSSARSPVPPQRADIVADIKRLSKHAAALGVVLALLCHIVPPNYRALCNTIASVCNLGGN